MKKKMLALLLVVAMLATCLMACGGDKKDDAAAGKDDTTAANQIVVQVGSDPETIDPALNSASDGGNMILHLFEGLLTVSQDEKLQPGCADLPEISEDGLTWTFKLYEGLKWSDGTDLTAEDFVYTWKRVCHPMTAAPYGETVLGMVKGYKELTDKANEITKAAEEKGETPNFDVPEIQALVDAIGVTAVDATTLVVELANPCTYFGDLAAFATLSPVQKATIEANGDAWATKADTYVSNGPFMLAEFEMGSHILMKKNPNYREADKIKVDSIKWLLMEDSNAAFAAFNSGEAHMIKDVPTAEVPALTGNPEFHVEEIIGTYYISINTTLDQFKDAKVRKALSLAIDRDYVANTVMQGTYSPAYNMMGPGWTDANGEPFADPEKTYISEDFEANLAEAKKLMEEAGYPNGEGFPTINYMFNPDGYHQPVGEYLQQAWKELGLTVNLETVDWSQFTPTRRSGDYEIARNGWVGDYTDASNQIELFYSTNGNNDGKYNNPEFDAAMDASRATADGDERTAALHKAEDILMEDAGCIPLAYYNDFWLQAEELTGTWHSPRGYWYFMYGEIAQ